MKKILIIVGIVLAVLGGCTVAVIGMSGGSDTTTSSPATAPAENNGKIADGKFQFDILKTSTGKTSFNKDYAPTAQGIYTFVKVKVSNIADQPQMFYSGDQYAYDASGAKYSVDALATVYANGETDVWLSDINPGNNVTGYLVFDAPKGKKLTKIELHDSAFSGGVTVNLP